METQAKEKKEGAKITAMQSVLVIVFIAILLAGLAIYINPPERKDTRYLAVENASRGYANLIGVVYNITFDVEGKYQKCFKEWDWENDITLFRCEYFGESNLNQKEKILLKFYCNVEGYCDIFPRIFRGNITKLF